MDNNFKILSGSALKVIAMLSMLIDHTALILLTNVDSCMEAFVVLGTTTSVYRILRKIGRLAFPIFCFLIGEGYIHTHDKKKYAVSMLVFALISEIPYNLMVTDGYFFFPDMNNIFFTLLIGFLLINLMESGISTPKKFFHLSLHFS